MHQAGTLAPLLEGLTDDGGRPAVVRVTDEGADVVERAELGRRVARHAAGLAERGIGRGDAVALLARPSVEWIVAWLALVRAGAVPVPLDTQIEDEDLARILAGSGARRVLVDRRSRARVESLGDAPAAVALDGTEDASRDADGGAPEAWSTWVGEPADAPAPDPDDVAVLFYTSGTTGPGDRPRPARGRRGGRARRRPGDRAAGGARERAGRGADALARAPAAGGGRSRPRAGARQPRVPADGLPPRSARRRAPARRSVRHRGQPRELSRRCPRTCASGRSGAA